MSEERKEFSVVPLSLFKEMLANGFDANRFHSMVDSEHVMVVDREVITIGELIRLHVIDDTSEG